MARNKQLSASRRPGGSQRQLRVGELVRHAIAEMLTRGDIHDPVIEGHLVTVPEVTHEPPTCGSRPVYVMPLGGTDATEVRRRVRQAQEIPARRESRTAST